MSDQSISTEDLARTIQPPRPNHTIQFLSNEGNEVGRMDFNGPEMIFTGNADESARAFIKFVAECFARRLEEERVAERAAEREQCARVAEEYLDDPFLSGHGYATGCAAAIRARGDK